MRVPNPPACWRGGRSRGSLARISHTTECIGAANQRKSLCCNDFSLIRGAPRCRQSVAQICLDLHLWKAARWWRRSTAGAITSDAGALLLGATDRAIGMMDRFASCFHDARCPELIEHEVVTLVGQRVFGIALGYEDLNDHDELRHDPMMAVLAGKLEARREDCAPVAGKSTLNRLELSRLEPTRYHKISHNPVAIKRLFVDLFLEAHDRAPNEIILDLDATDDPVHGEQEGRFFHGYYDCYCYLPLYVFCGRHLLAAKLRRANIDAAAGAVEEVARIVAQIRRRWPRVRILLRADSGFAREELMAWCEANGVHFLFGLAKNDRLIAEDRGRACSRPRRRAGVPASRRGASRTSGGRRGRSWSRERRVVAKAEWTKDEANPRFVVTSLTRAECKARYLYEKLYCARGDMENRIKECQLDLYADRTSTATMRANQLRLWFASMAYVLLCALRRIGLHHTPLRQRDLRHHSSQAAQDRRARARQRPPHQDRDGVGLSRSRMSGAALPSVSPPPPARAARPPDTRRRSAQPTRHHPQAHRDHFFAAPAAPKSPSSPLRSRCHEVARLFTKRKNRLQNCQSLKDSVRYPG